MGRGPWCPFPRLLDRAGGGKGGGKKWTQAACHCTRSVTLYRSTATSPLVASRIDDIPVGSTSLNFQHRPDRRVGCPSVWYASAIIIACAPAPIIACARAAPIIAGVRGMPTPGCSSFTCSPRDRWRASHQASEVSEERFAEAKTKSVSLGHELDVISEALAEALPKCDCTLINLIALLWSQNGREQRLPLCAEQPSKRERET